MDDYASNLDYLDGGRRDDARDRVSRPVSPEEYRAGKPKPKADKPIPYIQYRLTGGPDVKCISNGNTWADSAVQGREEGPRLTGG